ncbi:hypothetical protein MHIR_DE00170 [Candidatus Doolittlea endobia]|uniref:Uncharacterized protein n=1 Tax=Candidatus Doolittlea endobia TaxID=1778262 RepID=A0A143WS45_9ENTR|nr:hypothetical protein MHIR_DE00170 [Candidatus Doolittlea endobia]
MIVVMTRQSFFLTLQTDDDTEVRCTFDERHCFLTLCNVPANLRVLSNQLAVTCFY